ncbi:hypothetical protein OIE62_29220 [Streptomyces scopuliridis]|uniref:Uncharacterized protein n=1 Tax=Streptomyces scopuliridis TaxID=452529 RepID=A0ACD4ZGY1_9ACTN|nr:hypothetical protein [Streptomyces scopuliridis]WSB97613.1 hypothetical protein OG835_11715 [Streptomyces scopuliridis]WSC08684.1 hypothetical protein OIE62_29220 [Streptomyces scopuliridis]
MRGDSTQRVEAGGDDSRVRRGPRHAAPRKSLLTKLQIPAGKAMALAAMPTAVFVGMGLTPRLALADDSKDIPFAPGPCVTRSDEPSASASESPTSTPSASESASPEPGESPSASGTPEPTASGSPAPGHEDSGSSDSGSSDSGAADSKEPADASSGAAATPAPTKSENPLDPLGLGDALGDLLGVPDKDATSSPAPSASATEKPDAGPSTKPTSEPGSSGPDSTADGSADGEGTGDGPADKAVDGAKDAIKEAADKVGAEVEELDENAKGLDARKDDDIPAGADGKEPFPCPTADPEALAAAKEEQGIPLLPDDPWTLRSSLLTLRGLDYKGIVEVRTSGGKVKKALKFTSTSLDIKDLHQTVVYPEGRTAHVQAREGSTSTIRNGEVTMYTERLKGNLFGLIPITFSPETPPPLNVPFAFFTDVEVTQAGQFGGTLTVPGLQNYLTN